MAPCETTRKLQVPFLLLEGGQTPAMFVTMLDNLAKCLGRVERATIPGATHVFPRSHTAEFVRAVLDFTARH